MGGGRTPQRAKSKLRGLRALIAESHIDLPADLPAAAAGLFGYLGYDMIRLVEHLPDVNPIRLACPMRFCSGPRLLPSSTV